MTVDQYEIFLVWTSNEDKTNTRDAEMQFPGDNWN